MSDTPHCPDCGDPLSQESWGEELCPHCLLRLALGESSGEELAAEELASEVTREFPSQPIYEGQVLGHRYAVRRLLGRGGMGEVWRAFDLKLRVEVALKAVRADLVANPRLLETLRQEVRAAREVSSPNVSRVYDLEELDERELVSMEYVSGATLLEVLRSEGPLDLQRAREIASQLLAGLEAIHRAGLVHRDLKPENVMITPAGRVVVMDFGIAKGLAEAAPGLVAGTPAYMAPEQRRGEAVDARADVFSAGMVLAEMLAPAGDEAREELWRGVREEPPQLPDSPWRMVLTRAVAADPGRRFATASALARALEEVALRVEGAEELRPYPGLTAFTEQDREYFFGRELEVERMWKTLRRLHMLALIGPSGAGKTSFLQAGLFAAEPAGWVHLICTPGTAPATSLREALVPALSGDAEAMRELVRLEDPDAMVSAVARWRGRSRHALLVVDQFEELFTLNPPEVQAGFAELLGRLVLEADVRVLLSMRDDFLIHCHAHEPLEPILSELTVLGPPTGAALRRALVQPALKCGYRFEDEELVDEMLEEVREERAALPLLAFAAEQLWELQDRDRGLLTREAYERIGGVGGALAQHAELTLERIGSDRTPTVRELLRNLVTAQGTRAVRERDELLSVFGGADRATAVEVLDALVNARLLTSYGVESADESEVAEQRVEIVHESLLSAWPRLVRWLAQDVEGGKLRDELRQAARAWQDHDRPDDRLWTGTAFREYQLWRERYPGRLSELEEAFARAMESHASRRRRRRRAVLTAGFAAVVLVALALGILWRRSVVGERRAEAARMIIQAEVDMVTYGPSAGLWAAPAILELADTRDARRLAVRALWAGPGTFDPEGRANAVQFSPDGRWLASPYLWDLRITASDGRDMGSVRTEGHEGFMTARFSPSSDRVACGTAGRLVFVFSVPELDQVASLECGDQGTGLAYGFFLDRSRLVTVAMDDKTLEAVIERWSLDTGGREALGRVAASGRYFDLDPGRSRLAYAVGSEVRTVRIDGEELGVPALAGRLDDEVAGVAFHPDGEHLAAIDVAGAVRIYSVARRVVVRELHSPDQGLAYLRFSPDGSMLAAAHFHSATVHLWRLLGPPNASPMLLDRSTWLVSDLHFDPSSRWLAVTNSNDYLFPLVRTYPFVFHVDRPGEVVFDPKGGWLAVAPVSQGDITILPLSGGLEAEPARVVDFESWEGGGEGSDYFMFTVDPGGRFLFVAANPGRPTIVPLDGGPRRVLPGFPAEWARTVAVSPSGRLAAAGILAPKQPESGCVWLWDLETDETTAFPCPDGMPYGVDAVGLGFTSETTLAVTGHAADGLWELDLSAGTYRLLDAGSWGLSPNGRSARSRHSGLLMDLVSADTRELPAHPPPVGSFDLVGDIVVSAAGGGARVSRLGTEHPHLVLGHEGNMRDVALSADGRWIATSSLADGTVRLWPMPDLDSRPLHTLPRTELIAKLRSLTTARRVRDHDSPDGWAIAKDVFPGWETVPTW